MNIVNGGVTAPEGFLASGVHCGIKKNSVLDLALVVSQEKANLAGVYTLNKVRGNSLKVTMENAQNGHARAVIINSGNANACNGPKGYDDAKKVCRELAAHLSCRDTEVIFNSTGVIGYPLKMEALLPGISQAVSQLSKAGSSDASKAIMTTDTFHKESAVEFEHNGKTVRIGGMAKGSGMIHPNMATMIALITTDANISSHLLGSCLKMTCDRTFNRISVDGDTSVCDMVVALANGKDESMHIQQDKAGYFKFLSALEFVSETLAKSIAKDGEGATKLLCINCLNAKTPRDAYLVVNAVARSPLVKTAFFGNDANWGRIITAAGYSGACMEESRVDIYIGAMQFCRKGEGLSFDEKKALDILKEKEIEIVIDLNLGSFSDKIWTCDLSFDYVRINGSYRT